MAFQLYRKSVQADIRTALGPTATQSKLAVEAASRWKVLASDIKAEWELTASSAATALPQEKEVDLDLSHLGKAGAWTQDYAASAADEQAGDSSIREAALINGAAAFTNEESSGEAAAGAACARPVRPQTALVLPAVVDLETALLGPDAGASPVAFRMRVIYYLRTIASSECITILCKALRYYALPPLSPPSLNRLASHTRDPPARPHLKSPPPFNTTTHSHAPLPHTRTHATLPHPHFHTHHGTHRHTVDGVHAHSPLLRHEVGFVLGQLREAAACPTLEAVLQDESTVRVFRQQFTLEDAIGSHACSFEANMCVTNGIPLGCPLLLPVHTVNPVRTRKVTM
jgi:hypothetical protein